MGLFRQFSSIFFPLALCDQSIFHCVGEIINELSFGCCGVSEEQFSEVQRECLSI